MVTDANWKGVGTCKETLALVLYAGDNGCGAVHKGHEGVVQIWMELFGMLQ